MAAPASLQPLPTSTVAEHAYAAIRAMILAEELEPGERLGQVELADRLGISRTPVREALRRLAGESLVTALPNRGFRVADLGLEDVRRRLELRLLLEPGIARLAADRATPADLAALRATIAAERDAGSSDDAHDASRAFHVLLARSTGNPAIAATLEAQWIVEVGRRLLARRESEPDWRGADVAEHEAIADAVAAGDGARAEALMRTHVGAALHHWER